MLEKSFVKPKVEKALKVWNYKKGMASAYSIAKRIGASPDMVQKVLRMLKDEKRASKRKVGRNVSWYLK
jgi:hypothetical protein